MILEKLHYAKMPVRDVKIDYSRPWQKLHWRTLESAYGKSSFFLYYKDELVHFYDKHHSFLFDFNLELIHLAMELTGIKKEIAVTSGFEKHVDGTDDFRDNIHPKANRQKADAGFRPVSYYQVFSSRFGFLPMPELIPTGPTPGISTLSFPA